MGRFFALCIAVLNLGGATARAIHCEWGWMIFQLVSAFIALNAALPGKAWAALVDSFVQPAAQWTAQKLKDRRREKGWREWQRSRG